jgi:hypothetical protein
VKMVDRNSESYKKSEAQVKEIITTAINKKRVAKGLKPLPVKYPNAERFLNNFEKVLRVKKITSVQEQGLGEEE